MPQRFLTSIQKVQKKLRNKYILWGTITVLAISITILVIVFYDSGTRAKIHGTANETFYKVPESVTLNGMLIQFEEAATTDTVVHYEVSGGSAVQGEDYELFGNSISVPSGKTETTIPLRVVNDEFREPNETITFNIFTESGGTLESSITVTYTILDDDDANGSYVQGTAVLPGAVPDLQLWLDSKDESTLNLTTNNLTLTEWKDKSGQNNHFTQPNVTYQPTYDAVEKAIVFDGSDDFLSNSGILTTTDFTTQEVTMFAVYKPDNDTQYSVTDTGSSTSGHWRYTNALGYFDEFRSKRLEQTPPDMPTSGKHIVTMQSAPGTGTYKIWLDNELKTQKDPDWGVQNDFMIGKGAHGGPLRGNVYALAVYNRALTEQERQAVENYLSSATTPFFTQDSQLSGILVSELNNSSSTQEYIVFNSDANSQQAVTTDLPSGLTHRWDRSWQVEKHSVDGVDIRMTFDLSDFAGGYPGEASNYKLLYRAEGTGNYTDLGLTPELAGDQVQFAVFDSNLQNGFYTLGTTDQTNSPLTGDSRDYPSPVENLTLYERTEDAVKAAWVEPNGNGFAVTDYKIQVSDDFFQENIVTLNDGFNSNNEYTIDGIRANNYRHVRVLAVNQAGHSEVGNISTIEEDGSGKILHLKADSIDPNDPYQVRKDGSDKYLTTWEDISGNFKDAYMTDENYQPTLISNVVNGLPVIRFDGSDYLNLPTNVNSSPSDYTFFVVYNSSGGFRLFDSQSGRLLLERNTRYNDGTWRSTGTDTSSYQLVTWKLDDISGGKVFINGNEHASDTYTQRALTNRTKIGADNGGNSRLIGDIAEIIIFNRALNDQTRQNEEAALCIKYGLTCSTSEISLVDNIENPPDGVYNDAYKYEDGFKNSSGINFTETDGFNNISGWIEATKQTSTVTSECFGLPQPEGGQFHKWLFMDMRVYDLDNTTGNTLKVQNCDGSQDIKTFNDATQGTNSFDLRDIDPSLYPNLRVQWTVDHTGVPSPSTLGAKVDWWKVNGMSTGVTKINVEPQGLITQTEPNSYPNFFFNYTSNGARAYNARLTVPFDDINGWHTPGLDDGLSEDAEVDYGEGLYNYDRGIKFHEGISGSNGEPLINATNDGRGDIYWDLVTIEDGFSGQVNAKVHVSNGYVSGKDFAVRSYMRFGEQPANDLGFDASMTVDDISPEVEVYHPTNYRITSYHLQKDGIRVNNQNFNSEDPGLSTRFISHNSHYYKSSDAEDVTATIDLSAGTCNPIFQGVRSSGNTPPWTFQVYWTHNPEVSPQPGDPITEPISIHRDRSVYKQYWYLDFDLAGSNCQEGDTFTYNTFIEGLYPDYWSQTVEQTFTLQQTDIYRTLAHTSHRVLYEDSRGVTYNPNDYQSIGGAHYGFFKPGEYFLSYYDSYNGNHHNPPNNAHNVILDHSYNVVNLNGLSFHGIRDGEYNHRGYKSCDPGSLLPDDPAFHHGDPTNSGWYAMDISWNGSPWTTAPDINNPASVVGGQDCRIMIIKDNDSPKDIAPDYAAWDMWLLMQVCNDTYCPRTPDDTQVTGDGQVYTHYQTQNGGGYNYYPWNYRGYVGEQSRPYSRNSDHIFPSTKNYAQPNEELTMDIHIGSHTNGNLTTDARWGLNLYGAREELDFNTISWEVIYPTSTYPDHTPPLRDGSQPSEDWHGNTDDIIFHYPDRAECLKASNADPAIDPRVQACIAWIEVPEDTQPPVAWDSWPRTGSFRTYSVRVKANVLDGAPGNSTLEVRRQSYSYNPATNQLTGIGANNMTNTWMWNSIYYNHYDSLLIEPQFGVNATLLAPIAYPRNSKFSYVFDVQNEGNSADNGIYGIFWLPKNGVNGNEFTPGYEKVFLNRGVGDILLEQSSDPTCFSNPLSDTIVWSNMNLTATTRTGYSSESVDTINPSSSCIRIRRDPASSLHIEMDETLSAAINIVIPDNVAVEDKKIFGRGLGGSRVDFGGVNNLAPVETVNRQTLVGTYITLGAHKSYEFDFTRPGYVKWILHYTNETGSGTGFVEIEDNLPDTLIYDSLAEPFDTGGNGFGNEEQCPASPDPSTCEPISPNPDGTGGTIRFTINNLSPNDGNPGTGSDEGDIVIWTRIKDSTPPDTAVENCMLVTPTAGGTSGYHCTNFTTGNVDSTKVQGDFTPDRGTTPGGYQEVQAEDTFTYTLTVTNNSAGSRYLRVYDELHRYLAYVPGTFTVNGIVLPDTNVHDTGTNLVIDYRHPAVIAQGSDLTVTFTVKVRPHVAAVDDIIPNVGIVTSCNEFSNDSSCLPAEQTAIVEVQYGNGPPTAVDDTATTSLGTPVTIAVLDNDHDNDDNLEPATLIVQTGSSPEDGTAVIVEQNGVYVIEYTPTTPEYFSGDSFGYEVCDSAGLCDTATVTISIENTPPQASDDNTSTFIDTPVTVDVLANDTDAEGNIDFSSLAVVPGYEPLYGTVTITSSFECIYTPDSSGYYDSDAFSYTICDTENECDTAVVTIDLTNRPPIAEDDAASTNMTTPITINVLANDSDPDHNLAFDSVTITNQPAHGTVNLDGQQVMYTPTDPVYFAQDTFEYEVCDTVTPPLCDAALVIITITDEAPIASDDIRETKIGIPVEVTVLANDSDPDDNLDPATLELLLEAQPEHGTVTMTSEHTIIYTPTDTQYFSQDTFTYQVCDTTGLCDTANVIISITDQPPVAADDTASTSPGEEVTITVQDNDTDPEDNIDPGSLQLVPGSEPTHGSIGIAAGTIMYTPDPETTATSDTFSYTICDITGLCDTARVTVTITHPVAPSPTPDTEGHPSEGNEQQNKAILPETGKGLLLYLSAILAGIGLGSYMLRISYVRYARPILRRRKV